MTQFEHIEQVKFFNELKGLALMGFSQAALTFAVPNKGRRTIGTAMFMIAEGMKKGCPDVWTPIPMNGHSGLVMEFKVGKEKLTSEQKWWIEELEKYNWATFIPRSFEEAMLVYCTYMEVPLAILNWKARYEMIPFVLIVTVKEHLEVGMKVTNVNIPPEHFKSMSFRKYVHLQNTYDKKIYIAYPEGLDWIHSTCQAVVIAEGALRAPTESEFQDAYTMKGKTVKSTRKLIAKTA